MSILRRFDPPAYLTDLDHVPGGRQQWDEFVSLCFKSSIDVQNAVLSSDQTKPGTVQFFDPKQYDAKTTLVEQPIVWNAFPKTLILKFGRDRALQEADSLWPLSPYDAYHKPYDSALPAQRLMLAKTKVWFRPLDEYCEWFVERDPATGRIARVTFTSEPPEYWTAIFGGSVNIDDGVSYRFSGNPEYAAHLYRELTGKPVEVDDLRVKVPFGGLQVGDYNPNNKWNTTHGIAHLNCPPNSIGAEIRLGADATILRQRHDGTPVTSPDELICCSRYGGANRNSDPTIGATVNALARLKAMVTLVNPVGLYMDDIDLTGWELPDGIAPPECIRIVRGEPGRIERLVVEVPPETGRSLSDLMIGGVPLRWGGQIAECITVKLVGGATDLRTVSNDRIECVGQACVLRSDTRLLRAIDIGTNIPPGLMPAFSEPHSHDGRGAGPAVVATLNYSRRAHGGI